MCEIWRPIPHLPTDVWGIPPPKWWVTLLTKWESFIKSTWSNLFTWDTTKDQGRIQDFRRRGRRHIIFFKCSQKLHEIKKFLDRRGGGAGSANVNDHLLNIRTLTQTWLKTSPSRKLRMRAEMTYPDEGGRWRCHWRSWTGWSHSSGCALSDRWSPRRTDSSPRISFLKTSNASSTFLVVVIGNQ